MGASCKICQHPERAKIELGLANRVPANALARKFDASRDSIARHRKNHMPPQLVAALLATGKPTVIDLEQLRKSESEGLVQHLVAQRGYLYGLAKQAEDMGDLRAAIQAHGRINDTLALTGKLLGELVTHQSVSIQQLIVQPEYLQLRQALIQALRPFPDARHAVAEVLRQVEGERPHFTGIKTIAHEADGAA